MRDSLDQQGFVVLHDFLDAAAVERLIRAVESLDVDHQSTRVRRGSAFARRNLLELDFVGNLIRDPKIRDVVQSLSPGAMPVRAILFDKTGAANWTVPWHQDRSIAVRERFDVPGFGPWSIKAGIPHVQPPVEILEQMITLRLHLDVCGMDNGPLRVIAGTHHRILNESEVEAITTSQAQTACTTDAGGLLIMRPLILHTSSPATNPTHRRVLHVEFGPSALPQPLMWSATSLQNQA